MLVIHENKGLTTGCCRWPTGRLAGAADAWQRLLDWFARYLAGQ